MKTYFATPERLDRHELSIEINMVNDSPVISGLLNTISGLLAVVDEHRQIVALNNSFLDMLGISNPERALGLRLGQALACRHADDEPAGCGTTRYCSSCGAAVAMVTSLGTNKPAEKICALSAVRDEVPMDMSLLVKAHPITIDYKRFLLLFVRDITRQQNRSALERTFFHDINNMLGMLIGASELLIEENDSAMARTIHQTVLRLSKEVEIQNALTREEYSTYDTQWDHYPAAQVFEELEAFFKNHPARKNKQIEFLSPFSETAIITDICLLQRVLSNMIINALEATEDGSTIKVWSQFDDGSVRFNVWNSQNIPKNIQKRIFQRNFSTKDQSGRGLGTFSMKLFGEQVLGGKVSFTSSPADGTTFTFASGLTHEDNPIPSAFS